jgi:hydroxymethylbilane synthase
MASLLLRLGTRRSALARAQSGLMARALEALHPDVNVELVGIDTRGDQILDQPLSQIDGKEFFTAELDHALMRGDVDFTVHSFKDLALERPPALLMAAVPKRENPRDIALFASDVPARLAAGEALRIGSSSPRRAAFVPEFLRQALPGGAARIELCELRGNVDSRLRRLREPRGAARQLDGVVLAFAGLARLWQDEASGRALLSELLADLPRMVLPLTTVPGAPAQAALAIECRADDVRTAALLRALDDHATRTAVTQERTLLAERGGGCHQRFGATQLAIQGLGTLLYVRDDASTDGGTVAARAQLHWTAAVPLPACGAVRLAWDGSREMPAAASIIEGAAARCADALTAARACFIAHQRALPEFSDTLSPRLLGPNRHVWVPGTDTWYALAKRGVWVEGCAEGLGFNSLRHSLGEPLLQLPALHEWLALTHESAAPGWQLAGPTALATYRNAAMRGTTAPADATHYYWHSAAQFEAWNVAGRAATATAHHACGFGKTAECVRAAGVSRLTVFPSVTQWREWLAT